MSESANISENDSAAICVTCKSCANLGVEIRSNDSRDAQVDSNSVRSKCEKWLENCTISSDGESVCCSESTSTDCSNISEISEATSGEYENQVNCFNTPTEGTDIIQTIFNKKNVYGNVKIKKSQKVRLGNVTNIYGPVYITQAVSTVHQQSFTNQIFLELPPPVKHGDLNIVYRKNWSALPPVQERTLMDKPANFVIIYHTVSEPEDNTQAANTQLMQSIQRFHMIKKNFDDIGYNFLIGSDGNVYEGRGWSVVGAHTKKYNKISVGISFMGYFCEKLPMEESLSQAKILIERGIQLGAIDENYKLLAHCQCSETESPGEKLYFEIQKWDRWERGIDVQHPSPLTR